MKNPRLSPMPQISDILSKTCQMLDILKSDALSKTRKREVVECRQIAMYFCAMNTKYSYTQIGFNIAYKDHCTVLHAKKAVTNLLQTSKQFREKYAKIEAELKKIIQVGNLCDIDLTKWGFERNFDNNNHFTFFSISLPDIEDVVKRELFIIERGIDDISFIIVLNDERNGAVIRQVETLTELQEVYRGFTGNNLVYQE